MSFNYANSKATATRLINSFGADVTLHIKTEGLTNSVTGASGSVTYPASVNSMPSPYNPSGWEGATDTDGTLANETRSNPSGETFIGRATYVTGFFNLAEARDLVVLAGQDVYLGLIVSPDEGDTDLRVFYKFSDGTTQLLQDFVNIKTSNSAGNIRFTELSDGYRLLEIKQTILSSSIDIRGGFFIGPASTAGDGMFVQAAFFGIADDFPGLYTPGDSIEDKAVKAVTLQFSSSDIDGTRIKMGDFMLLIDGVFELTSDDLVTVDGVKHVIVRQMPLKPGDTRLLTKAHCRR